MRVLINILATEGAKTGIGHYTTQLVRCLRAQLGPEAVGCFPGFWMRQARRAWAGIRPWFAGNARPAGSLPAGADPAPANRRTWRTRLLRNLRRHGRSLMLRSFRSYCRSGPFDLYHEPNFIPLPGDVPTVATLHDLSVLLHPQWHPADRVAHFERCFHKGLAQCVHFLAISEFGRQEVIRTLGLRPEQVTRTYMGIRPGLGPLPAAAVRGTLARLGLPQRYLLYLGTLEPRKNVLTLLRAYCTLPEPLRARYPLLLVGAWGWNAADVAAYLHNTARHKGVLHLGYLADEHLPALYNGARALAFPSRYEGFGLPPVEMLACGGAVLASTAGAVAETAGAAAALIAPDDLDGWRAALARVLGDDDWWRQLRQGACAAARPFTWERCAEQTLDAYRRILAGHGRMAA
jgi:alpha-1,3-rhamnosyl/mannosyltransferase